MYICHMYLIQILRTEGCNACVLYPLGVKLPQRQRNVLARCDLPQYISAPGVLELLPVGVEPLVCVQGDSLVRWKVEPEPADDQPALTHTTSLTDPRKIPSHPTPKPD